jgi:hypothetical protein
LLPDHHISGYVSKGELAICSGHSKTAIIAPRLLYKRSQVSPEREANHQSDLRLRSSWWITQNSLAN